MKLIDDIRIASEIALHYSIVIECQRQNLYRFFEKPLLFFLHKMQIANILRNLILLEMSCVLLTWRLTGWLSILLLMRLFLERRPELTLE